MDRTIDVTTGERAVARTDYAHAAYQVLHWGFVVLPALTGLDKFFHLLTNWDQYLAPRVESMLPFSGHVFMLLAGIAELGAALLVLLVPKIGAWVVTLWLAAIITNLIMLGGFFDVALRDFGLMLAAISLGLLSLNYYRSSAHKVERRQVVVPPSAP
jgi:hypothetical protein